VPVKDFSDCLEEDCAFYCERKKACAIIAIEDDVSDINGNLEIANEYYRFISNSVYQKKSEATGSSAAFPIFSNKEVIILCFFAVQSGRNRYDM
jgi:hypothetical protein